MQVDIHSDQLKDIYSHWNPLFEHLICKTCWKNSNQVFRERLDLRRYEYYLVSTEFWGGQDG